MQAIGIGRKKNDSRLSRSAKSIDGFKQRQQKNKREKSDPNRKSYFLFRYECFEFECLCDCLCGGVLCMNGISIDIEKL